MHIHIYLYPAIQRAWSGVFVGSVRTKHLYLGVYILFRFHIYTPLQWIF